MHDIYNSVEFANTREMRPVASGLMRFFTFCDSRGAKLYFCSTFLRNRERIRVFDEVQFKSKHVSG